MNYALAPAVYEWRGVCRVRLQDDVRKCVVFLGYDLHEASGLRQFKPVGTGFFVKYDDWTYLVTARHVAEVLANDPFEIRANNKSGGVELVHVDSAQWHYHPDKTNDVALIPAGLGGAADVLSFPGESIATENGFRAADIGTGDIVHVVGLFSLLVGQKRNMPVVHTGHIAMLPDELIPVKGASGKIEHVKGYLVEAQTLSGLSGSPVFVRRSVKVVAAEKSGVPPRAAGAIFLFGVWSAAWDAPPGDVLSVGVPKNQRVPVGMGIVAPASGLVEIFEMPEVRDWRKRAKEKRDGERATTLDSAPPTKDDNPQHREDFNRLLNAAVPGNKSDR